MIVNNDIRESAASNNFGMPYPLPASWFEQSDELRNRIKALELKPGSLQRVYTSDPKSLAIFALPREKEPVTWAFLAAEFGKGIIAGVGGWTVSSMLSYLRPGQTIQLHDDAIRDIRDIFQESIADAFLTQYLADALGMRDKLLAYDDQVIEHGQENADQLQLDNAVGTGFDLVRRLYSLGYKALGGFVMAGNLQLAALRAKAERDSAYQRTYDDKRKEYSGLGITLANAARARLEARVGTCKCVTTHPRQEPPETSCTFDYDWGKAFRYFGPEESDPKALCDRARAIYYQSGTLTPIQNEVNPAADICTSWSQ